MLVFKSSHTGSIRENNQDVILIDEILRFCIIADGHGVDGANLANSAANLILRRIKEVAPVTSAKETLIRLREAIELAKSTEQTTSGFEIAVFWANRGTIATAFSGKCKIYMEESANSYELQASEFAERCLIPGQTLLLTSEGFSSVFDTKNLQPILDDICSSSSDLDFEACFQQIIAQYDGDDTTAILIRLEQKDVAAGCPRELLLFQHIDKQYTLKLWQPLSLLGIFSILVAFFKKRFKW